MLKIFLFGPFQAKIDDQVLSGFRYTKVRGLLAYLVLNADRPISRSRLAGMLWPDVSDQAATGNMRNAIFYLRKALSRPIPEDATEPIPFLLAGQDTLQFNPASRYWLDVAEFEKQVARSEKLCDPEDRQDLIDTLESAAALYSGSFLDGLYTDSPIFDEWISLEYDRFQELALNTLQRLAEDSEAVGDFHRMQTHARRQLEIDPFLELAHRQLIRALALGGHQGAALAHYKSCQALLEKELGVGPSCEMVSLYRQLVEGNLQQPLGEPAFSLQQSPGAPARIFVARERELAQLQDHMDMTLVESGRVVFVAGSIGTGKTALLEEFSRRIMASHEDVVVVKSRCMIRSGEVNPCFPFAEILRILSGDIGPRQASGELTAQQASRLYELWPATAHSLAEDGAGLMGTLLPATPFLPDMLARYAAADRMEALRRSEENGSDPQLMHTAHWFSIFQQITRVLSSLSQCSPLVLIVDDLQWADEYTLDLLLHLDRQLKGVRILVIGAYRTNEVTRHNTPGVYSMLAAVRDFQRHLGNTCIDLDWADGRRFADVYLDESPNNYPPGFRQSFHRFTGGNALLVHELWTGMQQDGSLVRDEAGRWTAIQNPDWKHLSDKARATLSAWLDVMPADLRDILEVASVEGDEFSVEVVARAAGLDEKLVLRALSGPLSREWNLVHAREVRRFGTKHLSQYGFRHAVLRQYLYRSLDVVQKNHLHRAVGAALEELFQDDKNEMDARSAQLAWHFDAAGIEAKAMQYLLQAGQRGNL